MGRCVIAVAALLLQPAQVFSKHSLDGAGSDRVELAAQARQARFSFNPGLTTCQISALRYRESAGDTTVQICSEPLAPDHDRGDGLSIIDTDESDHQAAPQLDTPE